MPAGIYDIEIDQGASFYLEGQWLVESKNDPNKLVPVDITSYKISCHFRRKANSNILIKDVNTKIVDGPNGIFAIYLNPIETADLPTDGPSYKEKEILVYDVEAETATGSVERLLNGYVKVSPNVTRITSSGGSTIGGGSTGGENQGGTSNGGNGGNTNDIGTLIFNETITSTGDSAWIDNKQFNIPTNISKLKITATAPSGSLEIGCVTMDDPWNEEDAIVILSDITDSGVSCIVNVSEGKKIRPIFNYYSGTVDGTLTIKLQGSTNINNMSATGTLSEYLGT